MFKKAVILLLAVLTSSLSAMEGGNGDAWYRSFDDEPLGSRPRRSNMSWGKMDDSLIYITNYKSVSKPNSLLIDRTGGQKYNMWGYELHIPPVKALWTRLSTCFQLVGPSFDTRASLEFYGRNEKGRLDRSLVLSMGYCRDMKPRVVVLRNGKRNSHAVLGHYEEGRWYRVNIWVPGEPNAGKAAYGQLEVLGVKNGEWKQLGSWTKIDTDPKNFREVKIICHRNKFRFYLDDLRVDGRQALPAKVLKAGVYLKGDKK